MNRSGSATEPGSPAAEAMSAASMSVELFTDTTDTATPRSLPSVRLNLSISVLSGDSVWLPYTCHMVSVTGSAALSSTRPAEQPASSAAVTTRHSSNARLLFMLETSPNA